MVPLEEYIMQREQELQNSESLTVVLTKISGNGWLDAIFHNQTTFFIEKILQKHENVATILVPYFYHKKTKVMAKQV